MHRRRPRDGVPAGGGGRGGEVSPREELRVVFHPGCVSSPVVLISILDVPEARS